MTSLGFDCCFCCYQSWGPVFNCFVAESNSDGLGIVGIKIFVFQFWGLLLLLLFLSDIMEQFCF